MEMRFIDLRRLIELWAAWYSIGVDGWLYTDESTHTFSLELPNPTAEAGHALTRPPYPPDPALDRLLLRALNDFGLQCSRLGNITFSRTTTAEEIVLAAEPVLAFLEAEQAVFRGKLLSLFSELRREYGDFGSHTLALELALQDGRIILRHPSFEMNNRRRGFKLDLWETMMNALTAYEDIYEQGVALGHSFTGDPADFEIPEEQAEDKASTASEEASAPSTKAPEIEGERTNHHFEPQALPFPCQSQSEANHLARLSNQVAPTRRAVAEGAILISTHPLRELASLITFVRYCEPLGALQRV